MADRSAVNLSTRSKLLCLINDIELVSKEMFEVLAIPRSLRNGTSVTCELLELLITKDAEVQETLKIATDQAEAQKRINSFKHEIEKRDQDIKQLQKNLKEAEAILATAIYQAKQKLSSIRQANQKAVLSEDLIKYAHRISANNSVAAPPTWAPGDPRRPYPTDIEMRVGYLGRLNELTIQNPGSSQGQINISDLSDHMLSTTQPGLANSSSWTSHDLGSTTLTSTSQQMTVTIDSKTNSKENEDVEVMSTDSSSSSSSDE